MKKLGLIGGSGYESTLVYYRELNRRVYERMQSKAFPEIVIESINLCETTAYMHEKNYPAVEEYLNARVQKLVNSGADVVALTAATLHVVYDGLKEKCAVPFISIPETAAEEAVRRGYHKVGLLGTIFTMEQDYLKKSFTKRGIEVIVPEKEERELVHDRIFNELEMGIIKEETVKELTDVIQGLVDREGIEAVILGCTELPLALNDDNCPVKTLDIMELHIEKLIREIM